MSLRMDESTLPRIVVIDDDAQIRKLLRVLLTSAGYRVEEFDAGQPALEAIRSESPDLVQTTSSGKLAFWRSPRASRTFWPSPSPRKSFCRGSVRS